MPLGILNHSSAPPYPGLRGTLLAGSALQLHHVLQLPDCSLKFPEVNRKIQIDCIDPDHHCKLGTSFTTDFLSSLERGTDLHDVSLHGHRRPEKSKPARGSVTSSYAQKDKINEQHLWLNTRSPSRAGGGGGSTTHLLLATSVSRERLILIYSVMQKSVIVKQMLE